MKNLIAKLGQAFREGLILEVEAGNLRVNGPSEIIEKYLPFLRQHKPEILAYLGLDPTDEIFAALDEYDALINRLCDLRGDPLEHRDRLLQARRSMAPADLPDDLTRFKQHVEKTESQPGQKATSKGASQ